MQLHARTSARMMTARDPWVNILRATVASFAAIAGGADSLTVAPFDAALNVPDGFSRRIARNVQIILQEEARLGQVIDPAGGSWHLERRTADLAEAAWDLFRKVQRRGGLVAGLREGWIQAAIAERREAQARAVAARRAPLTGVSEFPDLDEAPVRRDRPGPSADDGPGDMRLAGEDGAAHDPIAALPPGRTAAPFEALRDAADAHRARTGAPPRVFLCNLGPFARHNARASWVRNALAAGGLAAESGPGHDDPAAAAAAFAASGTRAAVICGADEAYAGMGPAVAAALREAGAQPLLLAGRFGDREADWRAAGVGAALHLGCDVLSALRDLHRALEVAP
jgi:methylmalonyl-CoA mutase